MDNKVKKVERTSAQEKDTAERTKYNKTWQALIDKPINMVVYDKTLFYR